jgi:hypothetical protein
MANWLLCVVVNLAKKSEPRHLGREASPRDKPSSIKRFVDRRIGFGRTRRARREGTIASAVTSAIAVTTTGCTTLRPNRCSSSPSAIASAPRAAQPCRGLAGVPQRFLDRPATRRPRPLHCRQFRGSFPHPTRSLCTLRARRHRRPRNTRYQAARFGLTWAGLAPAGSRGRQCLGRPLSCVNSTRNSNSGAANVPLAFLPVTLPLASSRLLLAPP